MRDKRVFLPRVGLAILWIGLNANAIVSSSADPIPQLVAKTKPATVQIVALDENWSPIKSGTGFFISPDGLIVTNYHVIRGAAHLAARTNEGATFEFQRIVAEPQGIDLAILKFSADGAPFLKLGKSTDAGCRLSALHPTISDREQNIRVTRSADFSPANQILAFQFPNKLVDRKRK